MGESVLLVYYSGTGGTRLVADCFESTLLDTGCEVMKHSLNINEFNRNRNNYMDTMKQVDRIILLYAVYAMDAPAPVYEWIDCIPGGVGLPVAVLSISGGGEVWPNTSCRVAIKRELMKKGYDPYYENMIVMPSNWITQGSDHVVMHLLNKLPEAVYRIAAEIMSGKKRRSPFRLGTRILMPLSRLEKKQAAEFGRYLEAGVACTGCGWCGESCPRGNIHMENGKPVFGDRCIICLRCIYGCPQKALKARKWDFVVVKSGFDLEAVKKRMEGIPLEPVEKCCKGLIWSGVRRYLQG